MIDYDRILLQLRGRLARQEKSVEETKAHIAVVEAQKKADTPPVNVARGK